MLQGSYLARGSAQYADAAQLEASDIAYDPSVITLLEEAINMGVLPPFRCPPCLLLFCHA